jgi:hypothetical protein
LEFKEQGSHPGKRARQFHLEDSAGTGCRVFRRQESFLNKLEVGFFGQFPDGI